MKIVQITKWYLPYTGGIEKTVEQLATGMAERRAKVRVLTCHHQRSWRTTHEVLDGIPVTRAQSFGNLLSTPVSPAFVPHFYREGRRADLLHFHVPFPLAEALQAIDAASDTPAIATYHSNPAGSRWGAIEPLYRPVLRRFLDRMDAIVTTSPQLIEHSDPLDGFEEKCHVVPLASTIEVENPSERLIEELKQRHGLRAGRTVLSVGRLVYYKGFHHLVEALTMIDAEAVIVGEGQLESEIEDLACRRGVQSRVHLVGRVSDAELAAFYELADVFVLPSVAPVEAFGIVQVEALSHGLPVVNTELPTGVPYVSRDGETGLTVPPGDSQSLASAIERILEDPDFRQRLSRKALQRAQDFSEDRTVEAYQEIYRSVLSGDGPAPR